MDRILKDTYIYKNNICLNLRFLNGLKFTPKKEPNLGKANFL